MNRLRRRTFLRVCAASGSSLVYRHSVGRTPGGKATVVIIGGGFAGASCALALRHSNPAIAVTLVDPDDRYVTCPMSNSVLVGLRDLESISVSRTGLERAGVEYVRDRVSAVDTRARRARLDGGAVLSYDRLVMAAGIRLLWNQPEGYTQAAAQLMPHAWQAGPQTALLAAQLRGIRDGGVFAISVPAGPMRCPPGPFERASLVAWFLQRHKPRCKVLIFDANNHFPRQDVFMNSWRDLYPGMIEWIPVVEDGAVLRVVPETMTLQTSRRTQRVDVANIIPPQAPALLAAQIGLAADHGWCPVHPTTFESCLIPGVHVIGDACIAAPMPKAASAANAQGKQCASAIVATLCGRASGESLLQSVCYSMLAPGTALSIHGRYRVGVTGVGGDSGIEQLPVRDAQSSVTAAREAVNAEHWYRSIVADSFGT